jgi:hypothetical protein
MEIIIVADFRVPICARAFAGNAELRPGDAWHRPYDSLK